jgi:hypothetical protein
MLIIENRVTGRALITSSWRPFTDFPCNCSIADRLLLRMAFRHSLICALVATNVHVIHKYYEVTLPKIQIPDAVHHHGYIQR